MPLSRRHLLLGTPFILAGCVSQRRVSMLPPEPQADPYYRNMYAAIQTEPFPVKAVDLGQVDSQFLRTVVDYHPINEPPGTIVVDPTARYAYLLLENNRSIRYGVGVAREQGFSLQGESRIGRKAEWPGWRPTQDMIAREPERYGPLKDGLPGGPRNPLGARALYLYQNGRDTLYRLHGTIEPWTIGKMVSSGCIRFLNQDIIDLYNRVPVGTRVIILPAGGSPVV